MSADGVYIPKEQNSTEINQFRPISLLNVEGKIFFSVMESSFTKYLTENGYINTCTSVQKGDIPRVFGSLEHATMIWEAIQRAKSEKLNVNVIWFNLTNAYRSVPHQMIQLALRMYHVPEDIQVMLDDYFSGFQMRFSINSYTTSSINKLRNQNCHELYHIPNPVHHGCGSHLKSSRRELRPSKSRCWLLHAPFESIHG